MESQLIIKSKMLNLFIQTVFCIYLEACFILYFLLLMVIEILDYVLHLVKLIFLVIVHEIVFVELVTTFLKIMLQ